jgi:hypothetical protein
MIEKTSEIVAYLFARRREYSAERASLAASANAEAVAELDARIVDIKEAEILIGGRDIARERGREKAARHRDILLKCRATLDRVQELNRDFEKQGFRVAEARNQVDRAFDKIMQCRDKRPKPAQFPTDAELKAQHERESRAEAAHREAVAALRVAAEAQGTLGNELLRARENLGRLEFQERELRRANPPPPQYEIEHGAVGQVSAVR